MRGTVGEVEQDENGKYKPETYKLDQIRVRFMAPSTHHTMGGVMVNAQRHMLDNDGNAIAGLYAAGEITGGIHAGNRLGGNAVIEIIVSGRTAAVSYTHLGYLYVTGQTQRLDELITLAIARTEELWHRQNSK